MTVVDRLIEDIRALPADKLLALRRALDQIDLESTRPHDAIRRSEEIAAYAERNVGTVDDLDEALEAAGVECLNDQP